MTQTTSTATEKVSVKETAAALRRELKMAFPSARLSVRMSTGTAYGWLTVSWTDGPTVDEVEAIASGFESRRFSGMDDSYHSVNAGSPWTCCGVNTSRNYSPERKAWAEAQVVANPTTGEFWIPTVEPRVFAPWPHADRELVAYQLLYRTSW